jgi:hypothetical protein
VSKKKTFVDGVNRAGFAFVGKLRVDANLKYKYTGPRTGQRGRLKKLVFVDGQFRVRCFASNTAGAKKPRLE